MSVWIPVTCPMCRFHPLKTGYFSTQPTAASRRACPVRPVNRRYNSAVKFWFCPICTFCFRFLEAVGAKNDPFEHLRTCSTNDENLGIIAGQSVFSPPKSLPDLLDLPAGGAAIEEGRGIYLYKGGLYKEEEEG